METLEKHISEVHRQKSNVQLEGIFSNDQTNESKPPEAKKTSNQILKTIVIFSATIVESKSERSPCLWAFCCSICPKAV